MDKLWDIFALVLINVLVLFSGAIIGDMIGRRNERKKAVVADVGRWVINPKTGARSYVYSIPSKES